MEEAIKEVYGSGTDQLVNSRLFEITNVPLQQAISVEFDNAGPEWGKTNAGFIDEFRKNTAVFSAFKAHHETAKIVSLLIDEKGELRSFREFRKLALQVSKDYNTNWLQTEYNTAVRSARAAINFRKYLETEHLYPNLEYIESTASEKRGDHLEYVGTILPIRHPWWKIHLPPSEWNCQCSVKPTNKEATEVPGETVPVDPVFNNNPGETAKFVNTEATSYYKDTEEKLRDLVEQFGKRAEEIRQRLAETEFTRKTFKSGGYIDVPKQGQNKNEAKKNLKAYTHLAKVYGEKYALLTPDKAGKNPDAINLRTMVYSDVKVAVTKIDKNAVQNSIKEASDQKATEVIVFFDRQINSMTGIKKGLKAALQKGRAKSVKHIVIVDSEGIRRYETERLRKIFKL